ncbi:hypothetical protein FH039_11685 [Thermococcus indicus]|uniref:Uncharacterized protein n=2 Tax=Thermococcus indicus TaxID=2586643 RepID=A0A4Y5SNR8_9EURY|nr:hypothetical protein FH039_11685 [Thermococcus indicus]
MKRTLTLLILLLLTVPLAAGEVKIVEYKIDGTMKVTLDGVGNAQVEEAWHLTPNLYLQMKGAYPTTYMLKREFENRRSDTEYRDMKIEWDDSNNEIRATYTMLGAAINRGDHWELDLGEGDMTLSSQNGNTVVLTLVQPISGGEGRLIETATIVLPERAENVRVDDGILRYELPEEGNGRNPAFLGLAIISLAGLVLLNVPLKRGKE